MRSSSFASISFAAWLLVSPLTAAFADSPSADDILKALQPKTLNGTTRGIRPTKPAAGAATPAQPASAAVPVTPPAMATDNQSPSINLTVQFATGSAQLTPAAMRTLNELGRALSNPALASYKFRIEGHTDTVGDKALNQTLSEARARAVVSYLGGKFNVPADRLVAVGKGSDDLLVPTPDQTAEPRNRRVQVVNIGA